MLLITPDFSSTDPTTQFPNTSTTGIPLDEEIDYVLIYVLYGACCLLLFLLPIFLYTMYVFCKATGGYSESMKVYLLPNIIFCKGVQKSGHKACKICQDEFNDGEILKILSCNHIFHRDCLRNYIRDYRTVCCPDCLAYIHTKRNPESTDKEPLIGRSLNYGTVLT